VLDEEDCPLGAPPDDRDSDMMTNRIMDWRAKRFGLKEVMFENVYFLFGM